MSTTVTTVIDAGQRSDVFDWFEFSPFEERLKVRRDRLVGEAAALLGEHVPGWASRVTGR